MDEELDVKEIKDKAEQEEKKPKKEKKKKKAGLVILLIFLILLLLIGGAVLYTFFHFYNRSNYVKDPEEISVDTDALESLETLDEEELSSLEAEFLESLEKESAETDESGNPVETTGKEGESTASSGTSGSSGGSKDNGWGVWSLETTQTPTVAPWDGKTPSSVYNLMLVGVDREQPNWNGNSDTMILVSINFSRKTVTMTSFMRDSAAQIPGAGFTKLNHSFAIGGGPLLLQTIRNNYNIDVNHYAWVDFQAMKSIFNIIGGVDLYLTPEEANYCGYGKIETAQVCHLNPNQAVMHCRDRSSGGYDYQRTQRQRDTLMAIANKAKAGSLGDLVSIANAVLPYITHNVDAGTVAKLISKLPEVAGYTFNEQRIPYNGLYYGAGNGNLVPLFPQTKSRWHTFVYGY